MALVGFLVPLLIEIPGLDTQSSGMLAIFFVAIALWISEAMPLVATAALVIFLEVFMLSAWAVLPVAEEAPKATVFFGAFADPVIILFLGGFMIADGAEKYGLGRALAATLLRPFLGSPRRTLLGLMVITAFLSMRMSNTATTATMFAVLVAGLVTVLVVGAAVRLEVWLEGARPRGRVPAKAAQVGEAQVGRVEVGRRRAARKRPRTCSNPWSVIRRTSFTLWLGGLMPSWVRARLQATLEELSATRAELVSSARYAALGEMAAGLAHEINNPVAALTRTADHVGADLEELLESAGQLGAIGQCLRQARQRGLASTREERAAARPDTAAVSGADLNEIVADTLRICAHRLGHVRVQADYG